MTSLVFLTLAVISQAPQPQAPPPDRAAMTAEFRENIRKQAQKNRSTRTRKAQARRYRGVDPIVWGIVPQPANTSSVSVPAKSASDDRDDDDRDALRQQQALAQQQQALAQQQQAMAIRQAVLQQVMMQQTAWERQQMQGMHGMGYSGGGVVGGGGGEHHGGGHSEQSGHK